MSPGDARGAQLTTLRRQVLLELLRESGRPTGAYELIEALKLTNSRPVGPPTVYNFAHIGNARPAVVFDVLYRRLERCFGRVVYARNFTDVDDKINAASMGPEPGSAASAVQCSAGPEKGGTSLRDRKSLQEADGVRLPARPPGACRPPACTRPSCGTSSG